MGIEVGNRGKCAQPCRLPYKLIKNNKEIGNGYLLSPKDIATINILKDLPNVISLKIEGRMKSPEYVATVVSIYRKYLDKLINNEDSTVSATDKDDLVQVFNRGGFSAGYLNGKLGKDMMCYEKPKNWGTYVGKITSYDGKKYITIDNASNLKIGDGIEIWNSSNDSPSTIISEIEKNKIGRIHGNIHVGDKVYKTLDKNLNIRARESYTRGFKRRSSVNVLIEILKDEVVSITINDYKFVSSIKPEAATNKPLTIENIQTQFNKTGNTPFEIKNMDIKLDNNLFIPLGILNEIRRTAFQNYEEYLLNSINRKPINISKLCTIVPHSSSSIKEISIFFNILREEYTKLNGIHNYYFTFKDALNHMKLISKFDGKKYILLPSITKSNYARLIKENIYALSKLVNGFVISNIGQLEYLNDIQTEIVANYTFNTFNTYCIELLKSLGCSKVICSPELTQYQINSLGSDIKREVIAYGRTCVMTSEYCPIGSIAGGLSANKACSKPCIKKDIYHLRDRMNMEFRIIPDNINCQTQIFNSKITSIETNKLNVDSIRLDIIDEDVEEILNIIEIYKQGKKLSGDKYTNGHLNRPV